MDNTQGKEQYLSQTFKKIEYYLDIWVNSDFEKENIRAAKAATAFNIASFYGQYLRLGGKDNFLVPKGDQLAEMAFVAAKKADFPGVYKKLEKKLAKRDEPMDAAEAIFFIRSRDNAQLAYLVVRDKFASAEMSKKWFALMQSWMEIEDEFYENYSWAFSEAVPWIITQQELFIKSTDLAQFPWFYVIPEQVEGAKRLPVPPPEEILGPDSDSEFKGHVGFGFVSEIFARSINTSSGTTHEDVLDGLSDGKMAANTDAGFNMEILSDIIENLEFVRVRPKKNLPGFVVAISHELKIDLIFQDDECQHIDEFEGATAKIGYREIIVKNGRASFAYMDIKSLYHDLRKLDEVLEIYLPNGEVISHFLPE